MKKVLILCVLAVFAVTLYAACATDDAPAPPAPGEAAPAPEAPAEPAEPAVEGDEIGTFPVSGNRTVTWWEALPGNIAPNFVTMGDTPFAEALQEQSGVTIEFMHPPAGQAVEALTLMIVAGDLPDIIFQNWLTVFVGGPGRAIEDGVIMPLNDVFARYAPHTLYTLEVQNPEWGRLTRTDDGYYYAFPFVRGDPLLQVFRGPFFRADWLEELGMDVPVTIAEWEEVLIAFRDEMGAQTPFTPRTDVVLYNCPIAAAHGLRLGLGRNAQGRVNFGWVEPEMFDYLVVMNRWFEMGLLDPDIATMTGDIFNARFTAGMTGAGHFNVGAGIGVLLNAMLDDPVFDIVAAPNPVLQRGQVPVLGQYEFPFTGLGAAITTQVGDLEAAARLLDFAFSPEGHILYNFGVEGRDFIWENGFPRYTEAITNHPEGWPMAQSISAVARSAFHGPFVQDPDYMVQFQQWPQQVHALQTWMQHATGTRILPPLTPTPDESARVAVLLSDIDTFVNEMYFSFVMGHTELTQANFDSFVANVFALGLQEVLDIQQTALDRFMNR